MICVVDSRWRVLLVAVVTVPVMVEELVVVRVQCR